MNTHYTYLLILFLAFAGPLFLSFDKKVFFYKKWKFAIPAIILPALFYIAWDSWFTRIGVWSFNEKYILGIRLINLPIEEILFFFIMPYCCIFIYECLLIYFQNLKRTRLTDKIMGAIGIILIVLSLFYRQKMYTASVFIFISLFIAVILSFRNFFRNFNTTVFLVSYSIILFPFLVVNGFLTALPVVLYNDQENLGFRLYTIPFEDVFYGMLLFMMNIAVYEKLRYGN